MFSELLWYTDAPVTFKSMQTSRFTWAISLSSNWQTEQPTGRQRLPVTFPHNSATFSTMAGNQFADDRFLSTNLDIKNVLKKCKQCYKTSGNGELIFLSNELESYRIATTPLRKLTIFLNIQEMHDPSTSVGHWILLCVKRSIRKCMVFDSLATTDLRTRKIIDTFCKNNNIVSHYFNARYQMPSSKTCGYLSMFIHSRFTHSGLKALLKLRKSIVSTPVKFVELSFMRKMSKHYALPFWPAYTYTYFLFSHDTLIFTMPHYVNPTRDIRIATLNRELISDATGSNMAKKRRRPRYRRRKHKVWIYHKRVIHVHKLFMFVLVTGFLLFFHSFLCVQHARKTSTRGTKHRKIKKKKRRRKRWSGLEKCYELFLRVLI